MSGFSFLIQRSISLVSKLRHSEFCSKLPSMNDWLGLDANFVFPCYYPCQTVLPSQGMIPTQVVFSAAR